MPDGLSTLVFRSSHSSIESMNSCPRLRTSRSNIGSSSIATVTVQTRSNFGLPCPETLQTLRWTQRRKPSSCLISPSVAISPPEAALPSKNVGVSERTRPDESCVTAPNSSNTLRSSVGACRQFAFLHKASKDCRSDDIGSGFGSPSGSTKSTSRRQVHITSMQSRSNEPRSVKIVDALFSTAPSLRVSLQF